MQYWSEGLGKRMMVIGLDRSALAAEKKAIVLTGICDAPAPWEYRVTVFPDDWRAVLRAATSHQAAEFFVRSVGFGTLLRMGVYFSLFLVRLAWYTVRRGSGRRDGITTSVSVAGQTKTTVERHVKTG